MSTPFPHPDAPLVLRVGDSLAPFEVVSFDSAFVRLRGRQDQDRGRVLAEWICPRCRDLRWAIVELGALDGGRGAGGVVSVEARPMARATLDEADWIHGSLYNAIGLRAGVALPEVRELSAAEIEELKRMVPVASGGLPWRGRDAGGCRGSRR
ncbi:MAG: hypothetical protein R3F14_24820 [Polyangiaceae bacterium]